MTEEIQLTKVWKALKKARKKGSKEYVWMKDDIFYVGTTGKTLQQALKELDEGE